MKEKVVLFLTVLLSFAQGILAFDGSDANKYSKLSETSGNNSSAFVYCERSWDEVNKKVVTTSKSCSDYTVLEGNHEDDWIGLSGYYVVKNETRYKVLNIVGDTHLILANGATLKCVHVKLEGDRKLYIYGESEEGTGKLEVDNHSTNFSTTPPNGGATAVSTQGYYDDAAGIGSGGGEGVNMGSLYVHGGIVDVKNGGNGAAIGGGLDGSIGGEVVIYGGTVTAQSISSLSNGAAIGGGYNWSQGGPVTIYGGTVTAKAIDESAGIGGGGNGGHGGPVTIYGGTVFAEGGVNGAGIGGGSNAKGGTVTIYGGDVSACSGENGACIGGGKNGDQGGAVKIYGGNVAASIKHDDTSYYFCNAIGGGKNGNGGEVHFLGGQITLFCGYRARAVGGDESLGTITFADNMKVAAGNEGIERIFTNGEREPACQWRRYARIEPCGHTKPTLGTDTTEPIYYTIDDDANHTKHCRYCNTTWKEAHSSDHCICGQESRVVFNLYAPGDRTDTYYISSENRVGVGSKFPLPTCIIVPDGYKFVGWEMTKTAGKWAYVQDNPLIKPREDVEVKAGMGDADFYARYLYVFQPKWTWASDGSTASVTLSHPNLPDVTLASTDSDPMVTIKQEKLYNYIETVGEDGTTVLDPIEKGTRYIATCIYTLDGNEYTFGDTHDVIDVPDTKDITLLDNTDNSETIAANYNCPVNVTLSGRTFYKDGSWNTICLPFDVDNITGTPLEGATIKTLASSDFNSSTGTLTLNFSDTRHALSAGMPYVVKWEKGDDIKNPVFNGVVIEAGASTVGSPFVDFVGTFSPVGLEQDDRKVLFMGSSNTVYYPNKNVTVNACRAYFKLHNGITAGDLKANGAKVFVLNFGDEKVETGISLISDFSTKGEWSASTWYSIDGRKLSGKPTQKGLYIHNGKKVVVK